MRKLATIRKIDDIQPIEGADAIDVAAIDGWKIVVKKGEFQVGDIVIYLEIDSWVPHEFAPFLSKGKEPREYNGVRGERLRTIKLRGQVSQGLVLPVTLFHELPQQFVRLLDGGYVRFGDLEPVRLWEVGTDLTEILGIQKWEKPIPTQMQGQVKGSFPTSMIQKTDQERIQNTMRDIEARPDQYEVTMKLDGSSCTLFRYEDELRVCSRNMELKINEDNAFVRIAKQYGDCVVDGFAFQGELMGPGIQGNREGFPELRFYVYDVFIIGEYRYMEAAKRRQLVEQVGMLHVPVLAECAERPESVDDALAYVDSLKSINHKIAEGAVWKSTVDPGFSFKTISNKFLLKGGD